ncbi:MAG: TonB-dependent receptor, partial [Gemmatimonadota bacterium]
LEEFFDVTDPDSPNFRDFNAEVEEALQNEFPFAPFQTGQVSFFAQDEYRASDNLNLTFGLRIDVPQYYSDLTPTPDANAQQLLDENGNPEMITFDEFPDSQILWSPRFGFNWDASGGERTTQVRGGTGVFSGRPPFVWLSNQATNPGSVAAVDDLKWPQVWRTNIALDQVLPDNSLLTLELLYGNAVNDIFIRNAALANPVGNLPAPDGRVRYDPDNNRVGNDAYITDNTGDGYDVSFTTQIRKIFESGLATSLAYNFTEAKDNLDSTEIAAFIFAGNPVQGNPNNFDASFSQFGHRHRITGAANYRQQWSDNWATSFGLFFEAARGGFFTAGRTSKYSYTYLGDVNGDGESGNDLIYIPRDMSEMHFEPIPGGASPAQQATAFDAFIRQDPYLSDHRGEIAERNGAINPWFTNLDLRILQDFLVGPNTLEVSLDILNFGNLINSDWGVREVVNSAARTPLVFNGNFDAQGNPLFQFPGAATSTFIDDISVISRWQIQLGFRYIFN